MKNFTLLFVFVLTIQFAIGQKTPEQDKNMILNETQELSFPGSNTKSIMAVNNDYGQDLVQDNQTTRGYAEHGFIEPSGWMGLSSYVIPEDPDLEAIFSACADNIDLLYNFNGTYIPSQQINTLGPWDPSAGYIAKFNEETTFSIVGQVNQNRQINLEIGWNLIPVLAPCEVDVDSIFQGLDVALVKQVAGYKLYWPEMGINNLESLSPGKAYFVLMNSPGSVNFPDCQPVPYECGEPFVDYRDGKIYQTVQIGAQCWMAENLDVGTMINGDDPQTDNESIEKYCYNNDESNCDEYGGLYQWDEVMAYSTEPGTQGICPEGWYLPTDEEWTALTDSLGGNNVAGGKLKETGFVHWSPPNTGASNSSGFTGLPGGSRSVDGSFGNQKFFGNFWTSTNSGADNAYRRYLSFIQAGITRDFFETENGFSVRCRKAEIIDLYVNPESQTVGFDSGFVALNVFSNASWTVEENTDWFTVSPLTGEGNQTLLVTYEFNELEEPRTGEITLTAAGGTPQVTATITQEPYEWSCGYPIEDERDGKEYNTVLIGDQCWLAESLNIGEVVNEDEGQADNGVIEKYCFDNNNANCDTYGGLYQWNEMMQYVNGVGLQGICPEGWHLPSAAEWNLLLGDLGGQNVAGGKMKTTGTIEDETGLWYAPNTGATNSSGFSGDPAGFRTLEGAIDNIGYSNSYWSSALSMNQAESFNLLNSNAEVLGLDAELTVGYSVRCIQDDPLHTYATASPVQQNVTVEAGEVSYTINSNTDWTIENDADWITISPENGSGDGEITVTYQNNTLEEERTAAFSIVSGGESFEVYLVQDAFVPELIVEPMNINLPASEGTFEIIVASNLSWMVIENVSWFTVSPANGNGNDTLILSYNQNSSPAIKTGEFYIMDIDGDPISLITINQMGIYHCGEKVLDIRDGNKYKTVQIGNRCWMSENMAYLPSVHSCNWQNSTNPYYYVYGYFGSSIEEAKSLDNYQEFGALYNFPAAITACPDGWSLPSDDDWKYLEGTVDSQYPVGDLEWLYTNFRGYDAGKNLKSDSSWYNSYGWNGTNDFGFSASPGGYVMSTSSYMLHRTGYWTSTENYGESWARILWDVYDEVSRKEYQKKYGLSVRCMRDLQIEIITGDVVEIGIHTAKSGGDVFYDGMDTILTKGVVWSTQDYPTLDNNEGFTINGGGIGEYISNLTDLDAETLYYVRAYATSNSDTAYGEQRSFTTLPLTIPEVTTNTVNSIMATSAITGGNVTFDGGADVIGRGIVLGLDENPSLVYNIGFTEDGAGLGEFQSNISGLEPETNYYVRAYATNSTGTAYGENIMFVTQALELPAVETASVGVITSNSAISGGNVTDNGGEYVTSKGVVWSTGSNPTIENYDGITENGDGLGEYISYISGLSSQTTYFVRAYAVNLLGIGYGEIINFTTEDQNVFTCGDTLLDGRDGQEYETVSIGGYCWMAENLNVGAAITGGEDMTDNGTIEKYCYDNSSNNCDQYGGIYFFGEAINYNYIEGARGICPYGWHIPTDEEWKYLEGTVDSEYPVGDPIWDNTGYRGSDAGFHLKSTSGWNNNGNGDDAFGFNGLPGSGFIDAGFYGMGYGAYFWTSLTDSYELLYRELSYSRNGISRDDGYSGMGISVRCVKNIELNSAPTQPDNPSPFDETSQVSLDVFLQWECFDIDDDELSFDIYFDVNNNPELLIAGITEKSYEIAQLEYNTTYYWKIVAHDTTGNATSGPVWSFTTLDQNNTWQCGDSLFDFRDNKTYGTVSIGSKCWLSENLNVGNMIYSSQGQSNNGIIEKYCFDDDPANCDLYGGMYQWGEMMNFTTYEQVQGICPPGWWLPSDSDWSELEGYADSQFLIGDPEWDNYGSRGYDVGLNLKSTFGWNDNGNGTDIFGFSALPGGERSSYYFNYQGSFGYWWSSSENSISSALYRGLLYYSNESYRNADKKIYGFSVRCLRNNSNPPSTFSLNVEVNPPETGTVNGAGQYEAGENVSITAEANPGWEFVNWTDEDTEIISETPDFTYTMQEQDITLTANFVEEQTGYNCGDLLIDPRDEQQYETVQIGDQCWMAENLNIGQRIYGSEEMTDNGTLEKYCCDDDPVNCETYGGLYQWKEMMQYTTTAGAQGICPEGWHIPTDDEWKILEGYVDSEYGYPDSEWDNTGFRGLNVGQHLKSTSGWNSNGNGTNLYGFGALPGGIRFSDGLFIGLGYDGYWWSSSESSGTNAWFRYLSYVLDGSYRYFDSKSTGFSVRCLKYVNIVPTYYNLNLELNPTEAGELSGAGQYEAGENISITAEANPGWEFVNWTDEDSEIISETPDFTYTMPEQDITLTANFVEEQTGFNCGDLLIDPRDEQQYETVQIGEQCWMAENLAYLPEVSPSSQGNNSDPYYYIYNYQGTNVAEAKATTNYQTYGVLYNWPASLNACPEGWHLPTDAEWTNLNDYVSSQPEFLCNSNTNSIAKALAATTNWISTSYTCAVGNNLLANNATGFSGLPGGDRQNTGDFIYLGYNGNWWTSTEDLPTNAWYRYISCYNAVVVSHNFNNNKSYGYSVRCLRDNTNPPSSFSLYLEVNPAESGTASGAGQYEAGENISITAEANPGWEFVNWTDEDSEIVSETPDFTYTMPEQDITLTANFVEEQTGFNCGDLFIDPRDEQQYETVQIGDQCWMAENLNLDSENGYCYENDPQNCETYGRLYDWETALTICPEGWHLPSDDEWKILEGTADSQYPVGDPIWDESGDRGFDVGKNLKNLIGWNNNGNGVDIYGFGALPGAYRTDDGNYYNLGYNGVWWSSTESNTNIARARSLYYDSDKSKRSVLGSKDFGYSIRCLLDIDNYPPNTPVNPIPEDGAINISIYPTLGWNCTDIDQDPLTFDVYFGTENPPVNLVSESQSSMTFTLDMLQYETTYYWRIDAYDNQGGSREGMVWSFTTTEETTGFNCGQQLFDPRDEQDYATVQLGDQCWMAENLNIGNLISGGTEMADNGIIEKYCVDNNQNNCGVFGGLYQWNEVMQYTTTEGTQGICPEGWHVPADDEWEQLIDFVKSMPQYYCNGSSVYVAKALASTQYWTGSTGTCVIGNEPELNNATGFGGLAGSSRSDSGTFSSTGYNGYHWTSTLSSSDTPWQRTLNWQAANTFRNNNFSVNRGFSVRCILDND